MSQFHFEDGDSLRHVRETVIHGMSNKLDIVDDRINTVTTGLSDCSTRLISAEAAIDALEAAGPGNGGSGAPLTAAAIEALIDDTDGNVDASVVGDKLVLTAAGGEGGSGSFLDLTDTPVNYPEDGAGHYLRINEAGTGLEFRDPNAGDEQAFVNSTQVYGAFYIPGNTVGGGEAGRTALCGKSTYTMFASNINYMVLPEIVSSTTVPTDGKVRTGRVLSFATFNAPATLKKPVASSGQRIYANGGLVDELVLDTGENVQMYAMYNGSKFKHWIAVGGRYSLPEVTDPLPEDEALESLFF